MISIYYVQISKRWVGNEVIVAKFLILCCRPTLLDLWCGYGQRGRLIHWKVLAWKRMCHNWFFGRKALRQLYRPSLYRWASSHWIWADAYCAKIISQNYKIILSSCIWFSISGGFIAGPLLLIYQLKHRLSTTVQSFWHDSECMLPWIFLQGWNPEVQCHTVWDFDSAFGQSRLSEDLLKVFTAHMDQHLALHVALTEQLSSTGTLQTPLAASVGKLLVGTLTLYVSLAISSGKVCSHQN